MKKLPRWLLGGFVLAGGLIINYLAKDSYLRWDLTEEQRYTLAHATRNTLDSLPPTTATLYLQGDFPPTVRRLQQATQALLQEMQAYAGPKLKLKRVDPLQDAEARKLLAAEGIQPVPLRTSSSAFQASEILLYPAVNLQGNQRSITADLLQSAQGKNGLALLLQAEEGLEYTLTTALRQVAVRQPPVLGLLTGHKEYNATQMPDFLQAARKLYTLQPIDLQAGAQLSPAATAGARQLAALLIAQPEEAFTETEKFALDQYLMRGGNLLLVAGQERVLAEELMGQGHTLTQLRQLNLDDLCFRYGFKLNYDLVQDAHCGYIDAIRTVAGRDQTTQEHFTYFPLVQALPPHPITQGVLGVLLRFTSSLEPVQQRQVTAAPLLYSSPYSRSLKGTLLLDFNRILQAPPSPAEFKNKGFRMMGLAVQGNFHSLFDGREPPLQTKLPFLPTSQGKGKVVVFANGQLLLPNHSHVGSPGMPLDNKLLLLNALDWLAGDTTLAAIRSRQVELRTLDSTRVKGSEVYWQSLNLGLPLLMLAAAGASWQWLRRRQNRMLA